MHKSSGMEDEKERRKIGFKNSVIILIYIFYKLTSDEKTQKDSALRQRSLVLSAVTHKCLIVEDHRYSEGSDQEDSRRETLSLVTEQDADERFRKKA